MPCIPEEEAIRRIEKALFPLWESAIQNKKKRFPYEFMYELIKSGALEQYYRIPDGVA